MAAVTPAQISVAIQEADFDIARLQQSLLAGDAAEGAVATFTGYVRGEGECSELTGIVLEHYPDMTEKSIAAIIAQAKARWPLLAVGVVHRVGRLSAGEQIVWVGVSSVHRAAAFSACEFIMDYLKAEAPLWKKAFNIEGDVWVEAKTTDSQRAKRWKESQ